MFHLGHRHSLEDFRLRVFHLHSFRVSLTGFGCRVTSSAFRVSSFRQVSGYRRVSGVGVWVFEPKRELETQNPENERETRTCYVFISLRSKSLRTRQTTPQLPGRNVRSDRRTLHQSPPLKYPVPCQSPSLILRPRLRGASKYEPRLS